MTTDPIFADQRSTTYGPDVSGTQEGIEQVGWRKRETLNAVADAGPNGLTAHDLSAKKAWNHGIASAPLSMLHKDGKLARLTKRRAGYGVYVLPEHVNGRPVAEHRANSANRVIDDVLTTGQTATIERDGVVVEVRIPGKKGQSVDVVDEGPIISYSAQKENAYNLGFKDGEKAAKRSLTPEQDDLREKVTKYIAGLSDQPVIRVKRSTVLALLEIIKTLEG